jgi:hypothetical protein
MADALRRGVKRHFMLVPLLSVCMMPLQCATLERLSLDDMIAQSTAIVRATVGASHAAYSGPVIYTHYTLQVSETLKGTSQASIDVAVPGGAAGNYRQTFAGAPQFNAGDQYVFFLWTGKSGLTQVIGLTQGLFAIPQPQAADPMTTRAASHELMLYRGRAVKAETISMPLSDLRARIAARLKGGAEQ